MRGVCVLRGVERGPIYSSRGRFPANAHMEGDQMPWQLLLLEVHLDGNQARFSRPRGRPTPPSSPSARSFAEWLIRWILSLSSSASCVETPLPLTCGPLCKGVTPDVIFCIVVWRLLRVFVLFCSCSSEIIQTQKQLWSKVSDTNM